MNLRMACILAPFLYPVTSSPVLADSGESMNSTEDHQEVYIDQLIAPVEEDEASYLAEQEAERQPEGVRVYSTEYRHYEDHERSGDTRREDGVIFNWQRETPYAGDLELMATLSSSQVPEGSTGNDGAGGSFAFRQFDFAANENWLMDNSIGVMRSLADPLLSSSYRINLPSSLISGAGTWSRSDRNSVRLSAGRIGSLGGGRLENFDVTDGHLVSLGVSHAFTTNWLTSLQLVSLNGSSKAAVDHESIAGVLAYETADRRHRYLGHFLSDSEGGTGVWLDGDNRSGRWRHRYGVFRLDPDLMWTEVDLTDDQQGVYTRSELRSARYNLTLGIDVMGNNVDDIQGLPKTQTSTAFVTGNRRMTAKTGLGGTLTLLDTAARNAAAGEDSGQARVSVYLSRKFPVGNTRIELFGADIDSQDDDGNEIGIIWDQDWNFSRELSMSTTLSHEALSDAGDETQRDTASLVFRHQPFARFNWNGSLSYTHFGNDDSPDTESYSSSVGMRWRFHKHWDAHLDLVYSNAGQTVSLTPQNELSEDEQTVLFGIRHTRKTGRRIVASGMSTGLEGFGVIRGIVFFDENRDGERQAGERVASGIYVYLDGRSLAVSDSNGEFFYDPVPAGEHSLSLAVEDIPLPWGLDDETPRTVYVRPRAEITREFALTRINE